MKKTIFILIALLMLSGCAANYEIHISGEKINEELNLIENDKDNFDVENDSGWTLRQSFEYLISENEFAVKNYDVEDISSTEQLGIKYSQNGLESILNSSMLNQCYSNPNVVIEDNVVIVDTGSNFECYDFYETLDSVKVVLKIDNKVVSSNADNVEGNIYTWNISKYGNKQIKISYYNQTKETDNFNYIVIGIIAIIILVSVVVIMRKVSKKNDF